MKYEKVLIPSIGWVLVLQILQNGKRVTYIPPQDLEHLVHQNYKGPTPTSWTTSVNASGVSGYITPLGSLE